MYIYIYYSQKLLNIYSQSASITQFIFRLSAHSSSNIKSFSISFRANTESPVRPVVFTAYVLI